MVPRNKESDPSGYGFWPWAERVLDEHAESRSELEIRFLGEEGTGLGPTLEFFNILAVEFRRKSWQAWLPGLAEDNSDYVNPPFGLFPAPYPGDVVPLSVLRCFYMMGIAVGKALQDNRLMDLPLSRPFLKMLACYSSSNGDCVDEGELTSFRNAESCRERIFLTDDPLFFARGVGGGRRRHWLTGLLDFEDFAVIQPQRAHFFRQLLDLHALHESIREAHSAKGDFCLQSRLDEASVELLNCKVEDLCISMEFVPHASVKLGLHIFKGEFVQCSLIFGFLFIPVR